MTNETKELLKKAEEKINVEFADALDLSGAMGYLKVFQEEIIPRFGATEKTSATVIALKRRIRKLMQHKPATRIYLKADGDGYMYKEWLHAVTLESAKDEFAARHYMPYFDRGYDCTGQNFTETYRIFNVNGRYLLYHWVGEDC